MAEYVVIRPQDDSDAERASEWADALIRNEDFRRHSCSADVDYHTPADVTNVIAALQQPAHLACYFGHGDENSWLTSGSATVDPSNVRAASGKAVVSIACKTGSRLGGVAVTNGVRSWLGWTMKVPVFPTHKNADPIGDALVAALSSLGRGGSMQNARDAIVTEFHHLVLDFEVGSLSGQHNSTPGYYSAMAMRDHVVLHGSGRFRPLAPRGGDLVEPLAVIGRLRHYARRLRQLLRAILFVRARLPPP